MTLRILNILDIIEDYGEEVAQNLISTYKCSLNPEIEDFFLKRAIDFAKKKISITYLIIKDNENILAYFSLTHKPTIIPNVNLSKNLQKKLSRFAILNEDDGNFNASAFLIAQLGKNTEISKDKCLSGKILMSMTLEILQDIQHRIGGGVVFLECEEREKLLNFYSANGFKPYGKRNSSEGITYHQLLYVI